MVRGQWPQDWPSTWKLPGTQATFFLQGSIASDSKSGMLTMSGSCGPCPRSPAANPAKPAPSDAISSRWVAGTSLALGAPLISTNEQKKYSMLLSRTSFFTLSMVMKVLFSRYEETAAAAFSPTSCPARKRPGENASNQRRRLARRDQFRRALAGDGTRLESIRAPADVHVEILHLVAPRPMMGA